MRQNSLILASGIETRPHNFIAAFHAPGQNSLILASGIETIPPIPALPPPTMSELPNPRFGD